MSILAVTADTIEDGLKELEAGADEVIFALKGNSFTALDAYALEDLSSFSHFSLLMNRFYFEEDLEELGKTIKELPVDAIDSIYFQDPAVLYLSSDAIRKKLIYRPETLVTSSEDASWWMQQGIQAVSVSPLLTKDEIQEICQKRGREITIHGHLWMSASRRRLLSAYKKYSFTDKALVQNRNLTIREESRKERMPIYEDENGTLIYTDFIQQSFCVLKDFKNAARFYMESVYEEPQAIYDAIQCYRRILNGEDGKMILIEYQGRHPDLPLSEGYYGQKTIL